MNTRANHGAKTLEGKYYGSEEIHQLETGRIFQRCWLCIGSGARVAEPGSWFRVEIEGESLIVTRDREGALHVFYNVCRHRGTRLCSEECGKFGKYVVCPYHAWSYALDGSLAAAPHMDGVPSFDREELGLNKIAFVEWEGQILVNFAEDPEPFEEALAPLVEKFTRWQLPDLRPVHRTVYEIDANWKLILQNYSECYHCPSLHPQLNKLTPYRDASNDLTEGRVLGGPMHLSKGHESMTMSGKSCGASLGDLEGDELRDVHYYVIFPNMFLSLMPDYVLVHRIFRLGPTRSRVECEWFFRPEAIEAEGFDPSDSIEFWDTTNRQDWAISEESQLGIGSRAYRPGPYSNLENMIVSLDRTYLHELGSGTK
jgi:Rieske 2Fe-2S family protein